MERRKGKRMEQQLALSDVGAVRGSRLCCICEMSRTVRLDCVLCGYSGYSTVFS